MNAMPPPDQVRQTFIAADFRTALLLVKPAIAERGLTVCGLTVTERCGRAALRARDGDLEIFAPIGNADPAGATRLPIQATLRMLGRKTAGVERVGVRELMQGSDLRTELQLDEITFVADPQVETDPGQLITWRESDGPLRSAHIPANVLLDTIDALEPAISREETRYYLNGIYLHPDPQDPETLLMVATDGHRLVRRRLAGLRHTIEGGMIVPRRAVGALRGFLAKMKRRGGDTEHAIVVLEHRENKLQARFFCDEFQVDTRLIDGTYPDYTRVIPNPPVRAVFGRAALLKMARRIATFGWTLSPIALCLTEGDEWMTARWKSAEWGEMTSRIPLATAAGSSLEIGFQARYLVAHLEAIRTEFAEIRTQDSSAPTILASSGEMADESTTIVVMPMRLS